MAGREGRRSVEGCETMGGAEVKGWEGRGGGRHRGSGACQAPVRGFRLQIPALPTAHPSDPARLLQPMISPMARRDLPAFLGPRPCPDLIIPASEPQSPDPRHPQGPSRAFSLPYSRPEPCCPLRRRLGRLFPAETCR